jgi:aryl-alcohol dehydrogenase-like predicted oxidoreductase
LSTRANAAHAVQPVAAIQNHYSLWQREPPLSEALDSQIDR